MRNERFDARNYFDDPTKPIPPLRQNQFGVNVGGPLKRDRTFFFFSYEGQRIRKAQTQTFSVPTAALRSGDFSGLAALCDPLTRTAAGTCTPFAGNQIPANRLSPVAPALLAKVPLPTSAGLVQNLLGRGRPGEPDEPVQPQGRPPLRGERQPVRPVHDVPRARHAAVRHQLAERGARPRASAER